jgi:hypothetical protein
MESQHQPADSQAQLRTISSAEFSAKFRSKPEVYRFLAFEVGCYLPHYDTVTVDHLRDLAGSKRRIIKASDVKTIHVPHFEGLSIATMLSHARSFP